MMGTKRSIKNAEAIRKALAELGITTITEVAGATGLHRNTVGRHLREMAKNGEVEKKLVGQTLVFWIKK